MSRCMRSSVRRKSSCWRCAVSAKRTVTDADHRKPRDPESACHGQRQWVKGGHGALLSPPRQHEGRIAELVGDPPGFDRATEVPALNAQVVDFFKRQLLP
jgi:hypothetical protein